MAKHGTLYGLKSTPSTRYPTETNLKGVKAICKTSR